MTMWPVGLRQWLCFAVLVGMFVGIEAMGLYCKYWYPEGRHHRKAGERFYDRRGDAQEAE